MASGSRGSEGHVEELGGGFPVLETLGDDAERECLHAGDGLITALTIRKRTRQVGHFSQPATVFLAFDFNRERHAGNVSPGPAAQQDCRG